MMTMAAKTILITSLMVNFFICLINLINHYCGWFLYLVDSKGILYPHPDYCTISGKNGIHILLAQK